MARRWVDDQRPRGMSGVLAVGSLLLTLLLISAAQAAGQTATPNTATVAADGTTASVDNNRLQSQDWSEGQLGYLAPGSGAVLQAGATVRIEWFCNVSAVLAAVDGVWRGSSVCLRTNVQAAGSTTGPAGQDLSDVSSQCWSLGAVQVPTHPYESCWSNDVTVNSVVDATVTLTMQLLREEQHVADMGESVFTVKLPWGPFAGRLCNHTCEPDARGLHPVIRPHYVSGCAYLYAKGSPLLQCPEVGDARCLASPAADGRLSRVHPSVVFAKHAPVWEKHLSKLQSKPRLVPPWSPCCVPVIADGYVSPYRPIHYLEISSYDGSSAEWVLANLMHSPFSTVTIIDPLNSGASEWLVHNLCVSGRHQQVVVFPYNSAMALSALRVDQATEQMTAQVPASCNRCFDIIYIDGQSSAFDVLRDASLAWLLLAPGGIMIFNNVHTNMHIGDTSRPFAGVFGFLNALPLNTFTHLYGADQVIILKNM